MPNGITKHAYSELLNTLRFFVFKSQRKNEGVLEG